MEDLPRAARATRGRRLSKLLDEEAEADNTFWGQEAFKEENNDKEYEEEGVQEVDEFDSDFDDEEEPESEHEGKEEKEVVKKKRKLPYMKPVAEKKKKSVSFLLKVKDKQPSKKKKPPAPRTPEEDGDEGGEAERTIRKSTRVSVVAKQAERAARAALYTAKPVKRRKEEERKMSQEEMLLEAAQTEVINLQSLERMLAREEEVKKKAIIEKVLYTGPQIKFISKDGRNVLEFTKISSFPGIINSRVKPYPERAVCVITGLPARYKDPRTGQPYATKEAFKILRERFTKGDKARDSSEEIHQRKRTKVETDRDSSRAGVVKLKFKKPPTEPSSSSLQPQPQPSSPGAGAPPVSSSSSPPVGAAPAPAPVPVPVPGPAAGVIEEELNEADFLLDNLTELNRSYAIEDSILYETSEMSEASFRTGDFMVNKMLLQQRHHLLLQQQQQHQKQLQQR